MSRPDVDAAEREGEGQAAPEPDPGDASRVSEATAAGETAYEAEDEGLNEEPRFFNDPKRLAQTGVIVLALVAGIYFLFPQLVGVEDGIERLGNAKIGWVVLGVWFAVLMFVAYFGLFRGVVGDSVRLTWGESYQINMAGLAATRLLSAGGAGGIVVTYWALRKAGMPRRESACRMVAFLVLLYAVYMLTLLVNGILLEAGVFTGPDPAGLTIIPAAFAGGVIIIILLIALIPGSWERRLKESSPETRLGRIAVRLATVPATMASGTRMAIDFVRRPSRGGLAIAGAIGFWAANIAILWCSFKAFDVHVAGAVLVQGFFVGMAANLIPTPGGVGAVDAGMIGTFVLFGLPEGAVFAAVLVYRLIAFWLPIPPGIVAFFQLRKTTQRWERERATLSSVAGRNVATATATND